MAITFVNTPLRWNNAGTEPSESLKNSGYTAGMKPAANTFNYQINNASACLTELQTEVSDLDTNLTTLDGRAIKGIMGNGTIITPDSSQTVRLTYSNIGAAPSSHTHSASHITSGTLPIVRGGTGATTAEAARTNLEVMKRYVLYNNGSGTKSTITLNDSVGNYDMIEVYYFHTENQLLSTRAYNVNQKWMSLQNNGYWSGGNELFIRAGVLLFNNNTISWVTIHSGDGYIGKNNSDVYANITQEIPFNITQVFGYK